MHDIITYIFTLQQYAVAGRREKGKGNYILRIKRRVIL